MRAVIGITLVEIMVSILIGSFLSLAIAKVYVESIRNYIVEEEMARIQDNGRFAMKLLRRELLSAGFYAATPSSVELPAGAISTDCVASGNWALDTGEPVDFINDFEGNLVTINGVELTCLTAKEIASGTDIISVKRTAGNSTVKNGSYQGDAVAKLNQWYLRLEDFGQSRQWFYHRNGGFPSQDIGVDKNVDYWEYYARIFYIRQFSEASSDDIPTLCVESLSGGSALGTMMTRCLVEGVEDMQIEYGLDTDSDGAPNQYVSSPGRADFQTAVVARVFLLMRSVSVVPEYKRPRTYVLGNKKVHREDGYVRRVMSTTVQMHNLIMATS